MTVRVWTLSTVTTAATVAGYADLLTAAERHRAEELTDPVVRAEFVCTRAALRSVLGAEMAVPPESLRFEAGRHGKPGLVGSERQFNVSHSAGLAVIAVTDDARPVGVDVQQQRSAAGLARLAERYYAPTEARWVSAAGPAELEHRFGQLWARKEACVKVTGGRLIPGLAWTISADGAETFRCADPEISGRDLAVAAGYHAAVALAGQQPFAVEQASWPAVLAARESTPSRSAGSPTPLSTGDTMAVLG